MRGAAHIPMKLPSLNEYIRECRTNRYKGAKMKASVEYELSFYLRQLPTFDKPVAVHFHWTEGNRRRDLDNVAFAKKFILDALVKTGKLQNDDRRHVVAFMDTFDTGPEFCVDVEIEEQEET